LSYIQLSSEARPYGRKDVRKSPKTSPEEQRFLVAKWHLTARATDGLLGAGVPRKAIEALGVREWNVEWEVTTSRCVRRQTATASFSSRSVKTERIGSRTIRSVIEYGLSF